MRIRSGYSFRTAYGFPRDVLPCIETPFAPLTDRGSCYGFNQWRKLCAKAGKKAIYGLEVGLAASMSSKISSYATLVAIDNIAKVNEAFKLSTSGGRDASLLTYEELNEMAAQTAGSLAIILGEGADPELLDGGLQWRYAMGPSTSLRTKDLARDNSWLPIACSDNMYPEAEDAAAYAIALQRDASFRTWPQHILSEDYLRTFASEEAFANRDALAELCTATMHEPQLVSPMVEETMEEWCQRGGRELGVDLTDPVYKARLDHELALIHQLNFDDYFFIIADVIRYAKEHMMVGPGRGSSSGSLVCYLMGITTVDPIEHDLMFERFIDPNRSDLPDIDIDFSDQNRELVFRYMADKYGNERVARLGTVAFLREKSLFKALSFQLGVPQFKLEPVLRSVVRDEGVGGDAIPQYFAKALRDSSEGSKAMQEYPELEIASKLEGHPLHHSIHAAGAIVTATPVTDYVAVDMRTESKGGLGTAEIDKLDAQDLGILKIDALGLKQLSVFEDCLELIGRAGQWSWLYNLPIDDQAAFDVLNNRKFINIFQYNGHAVQGVSSSFKVETFDDMVATTSLARPGPMGAGGTAKWLDIRTGKRKIELPHEVFRQILGPTQGIVIYQEQLMQVGRQIGKMTWDRVTKLRKATQYFRGKDEMNSFRDEYLVGTRELGVPDAVANAFWDEMLEFGKYSFNKAHAVAYSLISYWCCYLKANHPMEYAAAMLNHEKDPDRQRIMLREMRAEGVDYLAFCKRRSKLKWSADGSTLIGPVSNVVGIGPKAAIDFIEARDHGGKFSGKALGLMERETVKTTLDTLEPIRTAVSENHPDLRELNIHSLPTPIGDVGENEMRDKLFIGQLIKVFSGKSKNGRGNQLTGILRDDTGEIRIFINYQKYDNLAKKLMETGEIGKSLWAVKGSTPSGGGIVWVDMVRYLGDIRGPNITPQE